MVEFPVRFRCWSVLQMVAIVVCYRGKVLSERAQGCVWTQLSLRCPEMKVIQITSIVLGDSYCKGTSCCIEDSDCTYAANENHRTDAHRRCDNKQSCTVGVDYEKIPCGYWGVWYYNDFERIIYNCIDDPHLRSSSTTSTTSLKPVSTENNMPTEENTPKSGTENESSTEYSHFFTDDTASSTDVQSTESFNQITTNHVEIESPEFQSDNPWLLPVVMTTVCLLILISIVFVVVMMRRKRILKDSTAVEMVESDNNFQNGITNRNEDETVSLDNGSGSPIYSNDKIKQSKNKDTCANASQNYEVPNNCVASNACSAPREDPYMYCDVDSREPAYQVPRPISNLYSVIRDTREPECAGSTADTTNEYYNANCDVKTKEPDKAVNSSAQNTNDEDWNLNENQNEALKEENSIPVTQTTTMKKKMDSFARKTTQDPNVNVNQPSKNELASEASYKVASKDKVGTSDGYPNPIYEEMFPLIPESMYANAPVLSPNSSVVSRAMPMETTVTDNPYCEMKSPPVKSKDSGN